MCVYVSLYIYLLIVLDKATNPRNHITDSSCGGDLLHFEERAILCHVAARVIATKIQSPQEWEAVQALNVSMLAPLYSQMSTGVPLAKEMITKEQTSNMRMMLSCSILLTQFRTCCQHV